MKLHGRKFNSPPPLVAKSAATGCGPNSVSSASRGWRSTTAWPASRRRGGGRAASESRSRQTAAARAQRMRYRRDQRQTADLLRMVQCQRQRDRAAQRMADDQRPLEAQAPRRSGRLCAPGRRSPPTPRGPRGIAAAGPVQNDDAKLAPQPAEQRMREIVHLAGKAVNQQKRRARAFVEIVDARAVDVDETARAAAVAFLLAAPSRLKTERGRRERGTKIATAIPTIQAMTFIFSISARESSSNSPA